MIKPIVHATLARLLGFAMMLLLMLAGSAHAKNEEAAGVVYRLYKAFAWVAIFTADEGAERHLGKSVVEQPKVVLRRFLMQSLRS